jgi:hypothetical protein
MWWKRDREGTATRIANGVVSGMRRGCEVLVWLARRPFKLVGVRFNSGGASSRWGARGGFSGDLAPEGRRGMDVERGDGVQRWGTRGSKVVRWRSREVARWQGSEATRLQASKVARLRAREVARLGACRVAGSRSCEIRGAEAASLVTWRPQTRRDASWATRDVAGGVGVRNASRGVVGVLGWQGGFACATRDEAGGFRAVARRRVRPG